METRPTPASSIKLTREERRRRAVLLGATPANTRTPAKPTSDLATYLARANALRNPAVRASQRAVADAVTRPGRD